MGNPTVTYTFSNGTTADATQVNTNFTDILNALTDGTKDLTINSLTIKGTTTIGDAAGDSLSIIATPTAGSANGIGSAMTSTGANNILTVYTRTSGTNVGTIGVGKTASSGAFSQSTGSTTTWFDVTNLTFTIVVSAADRPLILGIVSDGTANLSNWGMQINQAITTSGIGVELRIIDGSSNVIAWTDYEVNADSAATFGNGSNILKPCSDFFMVFPSAGSITYKVQMRAKTNGYNVLLKMNFGRFIGFEI